MHKRYVIWKEFGTYKLTSEENYNNVTMNAGIVLTLHDCNNVDEAINCAVGAGFNKDYLIVID